MIETKGHSNVVITFVRPLIVWLRNHKYAAPRYSRLVDTRSADVETRLSDGPGAVHEVVLTDFNFFSFV